MKEKTPRLLKTTALLLAGACACLPGAAQALSFHRDQATKVVDALHQVRFVDDQTVAFGGRSTGGVRLVDLNKLAITRTVDVMQGRVDEFEFTPDRKGLVITTFENEVAYYDMAQGKVLHQVGEYYPDYTTGKSISFTPDGKCFGVTQACQMVYWDKATGLRTDSLPEPEDECMYEVDFSADGNTAYCGGNNFVWSYDRTTRQFGKRVSVDDISVVTDVAMRADHGQLAVGAREGLILIDVHNGARTDLKGHADWVNELVYSPDGTRLYSCSGSFYNNEHGIRAWDVQRATCLGLMGGHLEDVESVDLSPNAKWIVSASMDGTVKLWNAQSLALAVTIVPVREEREKMTLFCFTPDGKLYGTPDVQQYGDLKREEETIEFGKTEGRRARKAMRKAIGKF